MPSSRGGVRPVARRWRDLAVAAALIAWVGTADFLVGPEFILAILYLIPIGFAAWRLGRPLAVLTAVVSWGLAVYSSGVFALHLPQHPGGVFLDVVTTLAFFVITALLLSHLREKQERLQVLVDTDVVTGAASAHAFYRTATRELARTARYGHPVTLAYLDIDNFKHVNDTYGHAAGDRLLRRVAETLRENIRQVDQVARLGGDEFVILFPEADEAAARQVLPKLRDRLLARMQMENWPVTFSVGTVSCSQACPDLEQLLREADERMYSVKNTGKNGIAYGRATPPEART